MPKGSLEIVVGCMSSGKSEELIRRLKRETIAKRPVLVFKPSIDVRSGETRIESRDGKRFEAIPVEDVAYILDLVTPDVHVVGFDEVQFYPPEILTVIDALIDRGVRVLAAGLDTDFRGEPFDLVSKLLAIADDVSKLSAVCVRCGAPAVRTQRLIDGVNPAPYDSPLIVVGGDELYEARCRNCHVVVR